MNILVTAGNTQVPVDRVRCLTNIFTGRTGAAIAANAHSRGHHVTLLTSHPEAILELEPRPADIAEAGAERWRLFRYRTFGDLETLMGRELEQGRYDGVIHCAAVSDFHCTGIFAPAPGTYFSPDQHTWSGSPPALVERGGAKVKSDEPELWLRLVPAPKLIDKIRSAWGFRGVLVKFKLEAEVSEESLTEIAERSRLFSGADLMVANTLEGSHDWALLGPLNSGYERVDRHSLPQRLLAAIEHKHEERMHG